MKFALGCAFILDEVLENFPSRKLRLTCKKCKEINGDRHRSLVVKKILREHIKMVLEDIIYNNVTFQLPLNGGRKCDMHMLRITGDFFIKLRKKGKWREVDYLKSMFTGYLIGFFMYGNRTPRVKNVYVSKYYRDLITKFTNEGKLYGDGKVTTKIADYIDRMRELFPEVTKSDIKLILTFSWKSLYLHNSYGGDTVVSYNDLWFYIGNLKGNSLSHFFYYIRKLSIRLRVLYRRRKVEWDGYYYFGLYEKLYQEYLALKNLKGRPKRIFTFNKVFMYLILDECKILRHSARYIFRVPYITKVGFKFYLPELTTDKAELILVREPLKFKDILVNDNYYEVL